MVGAALADELIADLALAVALDILLQRGLIVGARVHLADLSVVENMLHDKTLCLVDPAVEIDRGDGRLDHIGKDRGALAPAGHLLAAAETHEFAQPQRKRRLVQARLAHQLGAQTRHPPLGQRRLVAIEELRRRKSQDRVAQKLQPLIALRALGVALVGVGAVGHGRFQQLFIFESVADAAFKRLHHFRF